VNPLLPDRYPNKDFFVADIFDATPKDDMGSMEHPMFSLAKTPDMAPRFYEHNGNSIEIQPSHLGMPTIWDKDILIYCISQLMEGINRGREPSQRIRITAHDLLVSTNRETGGINYKRLEASFERLQGASIKTTIKTNGITQIEGFGIIDGWGIVEKSPTDKRMVSYSVKLTDWHYNAVLGSEVLTVSRDYFRLRGGLERRLYELARKHCGNQSRWAISTELLHKKTGVKSPLKTLRLQVRKIAESNVLPDYRIRYNDEKDQVIFYNRKGGKAAKAQFDDDIKQLFKPSNPKSVNKKPSRSKESQIDLF
jgi:plasmid replication initiation protein